MGGAYCRTVQSHTMLLEALLKVASLIGTVLVAVGTWWAQWVLWALTITGLRAPAWRIFVHILEHYRSVLVVLVVLPMSFVFDLFWRLRTWYVTKFCSAPHLHEERVQAIQQRVKQWSASGRKTRMCTARPGWMTVSPRHCQYKQRLFTVDMTLTDILHFDADKGVLRVEPSVNMLQIYDYLLPRGYTLPVMPELDELTVGGLVNGYGIETSSHKYGLFNDICLAFELVLPDAQVVRVTPKDALFHAIPWSFGTVAFLTAVELRVIRAAPYVKHQYIPIKSQADAVAVWTKLQTSPNCPEFLEGIMWSKDEGVIMAADFYTPKPGESFRVHHLDRWYAPYFYMHAKSYLDKNMHGEEIIPLRQYYQRHNRSIFWALEDQIPICHNPVFRFLLGAILPPRVAFLKLIETDAVTKFYEEKYVMQDWLVPIERMHDTISVLDNEVAVYPLWLCPHRTYHTGEHQGKMRAPPGTKKEGDFTHFVDCATIGVPHVKNFDSVKAISTIEAFLRKVGGYQGNYSYTYQTKEQYRQMFDHALYDRVRKDLGSDQAFPESFDKIARENQWSKKAGKDV